MQPAVHDAGAAAPRAASKESAPKTFYKKELPCPPALCSFSSEEGRLLYKESLAAGGAEASFRLLEQFHTQNEPAYCGLGTLVMVLNALGVDPGRTWKGPWRWFHEEMLDCCEPLESVREHGIIFEKFVCLARCNAAAVEAFRPSDAGETLEKFRSRLVASVSSGSGPLLVVSYSRKAFGQTGDGHYSPIGAYHRDRDAALILDVARFKLPPHWVPVPLLWEALQYKDSSTGRCRGYFLISLRPCAVCGAEGPRRPLLCLSMPPWTELATALAETKASCERLGDEVQSTELLRLAASELAGRLQRFAGFVRPHADVEPDLSRELEDLRAQVLDSIDSLRALGVALEPRAFPDDGSADARGAAAALFASDVLALPPELWLPSRLLAESLPTALDAGALPAPLRSEVTRVREQLMEIIGRTSCCAPAPGCCSSDT